jgi:F-box protein 11
MVEKQRRPLAFMSYVRFDDQHENGRLTEFRNRLSGEVRMQTGEDFSIFQDRNDIQWGQNWKERVEDSIDEVTFLIPIITPNFFNSPPCREELERFLARERKLRRNDLILPVYYVSSPVFDNDAKRAKDEMAQAIAKHQYADWRELRFEPLTSPQVGKTLARLAMQIRDALERERPPEKTEPGRKIAKKRARPSKTKASTAGQLTGGRSTQSAQVSESVESSSIAQRPSVKTEPPTLIVDSFHRGDFPTVTEAIAKANAGDRILVRPGLYQEGLVIDKPLEIIGDGELGDVVIQTTGANAVLFKTAMGRISNLSLRQMGGGEWFCVNIAQGRLELEGCDIISQSLTCVGIHDGADPRLRRNRIHGGNGGGVAVYKNGQGTLEDNDIFGNTLSGVAIMVGGNPTLRRNRIHDGRQSGVNVYENGQGTLEDNDIFGNALAGVAIKTGGNPTLRRNRIHDGMESGVLVYEKGQGTLEDNDIFGNTLAGVTIRGDGNPVLRHNRINKNGSYAVQILKSSAGTIEHNDLRDNGKGAWYISEDSKPKVKRSGNQE